ncbi:hydrophobic domain protein [Selenomonas sp. oral taxon 892 str. F0426]|uniref:DUF389 domain-containing protein n=1 Tax=Selenomonas sp. oral taxon 892 TaxID=1321785 RepID=UPI0003AD4345|nr:DUF389 domain-containing protein [Selenomonas sp. oral taxon 892]ERJ95749.1 hydrophobic domain protein [Selenomonas sp. oral taxon 892 str. F0426]
MIETEGAVCLIWEKLKDFFDLHGDIASTQEITKRINAGVRFRGTNLSVLMLAIFIASIGLNMNSTAVIIGAMLISPLMGSILGIGYGLARYDSTYSRSSAGSLLAQVIISVAASTLYFFLTPIDGPSSELLARTSPTIWDVLIAVFGGLAGIIGVTRKEGGNVIPGVAIATALMPPLCTAGYGIATGVMAYTVGALYLFFINSFFICLTAFIVLKIIDIPSKIERNSVEFSRQKRYLMAFAVLVTLPSCFFAYQSVQKNLENEQAKIYIEENFKAPPRLAISYTLDNEKKMLTVFTIAGISEDDLTALTEKLHEKKYLRPFQLEVFSAETAEEREKMEAMIDQRLSEVEKSAIPSMQEQQTVTALKSAREESEKQGAYILDWNREARIVFPQISRIAVGSVRVPAGTGDQSAALSETQIAFIYLQSDMDEASRARLTEWISDKAKNRVEVHFLPEVPATNENKGGTVS